MRISCKRKLLFLTLLLSVALLGCAKTKVSSDLVDSSKQGTTSDTAGNSKDTNTSDAVSASEQGITSDAVGTPEQGNTSDTAATTDNAETSKQEPSVNSTEASVNSKEEDKKAQVMNDYWPKDSWREATPDDQGMSSEKLLKMLKYIKVSGKEIHNIIIIRNGYQVLDANIYPYNSNYKHVTNSCTKSVTSALLGISMEEGLISGLDTKVLDYFQYREVKNIDNKKKELMLRHLLTMTAGIKWSENGSYDPQDSWMQMRDSQEPVQFFLDLPMVQTPGTAFYYNSGASHMLSAILTDVTGQKTADYARQKLLEPIGIKDFYWQEDDHGINFGGSGIFMTPQDMARFGYLFLQDGLWKDKQVVPVSYVKQATEKQVDTPSGLAGHYGYGLQWWMNDFGGYSARGYGGQYIFVVPEYNIVAVFTASLQGMSFFMPEQLMASFIIPSINEEESKVDDTKSDTSTQLESFLEKLQEPPKAEQIPELPAIAKELSGKLIRMDSQDEITLSFPDANSAKFRHGPSNEIEIGLDNVYRVSDAGSYWPLDNHNMVAVKGHWEDDKTFIIEVRSLNEMDILTYSLSFEGNQASMIFSSRMAGELYRTQGVIEE